MAHREEPRLLCGESPPRTEIGSEARLRESETKYQAIFDQASDGIWLMSVDGKRMVVNQAFAAMHGYDSPEQMLQLGLADLDTPETAALAPERLRRLLAGESFSFEVEHFHRDGHRLALNVSCRVVEVDGQPHFLGFHRDITARKQEEQHRARLEEQLHHAQKMEAIGTLGAGVAHDFNNILGALLGRLSLLELELGAAADAHRTHLREMRELIERGAALARQLLGLGRRGKYEVQPLDVAAAVRKTSALFGGTRRDITLRLKLAPDLRCVVMDRTQLEQVLLNLFLNAGQAMPDGGELAVSAENMLLSEDQRAPIGLTARQLVRLVVADTGIGMDAETRARIFEPFFTTRAVGVGTGLGLASAYGIIEHHGGTITVDSEPGRGATFTILLPATDERPVDEPPSARAPHAGHETILVVDDEPPMRSVCAALLERLGYDVLTASGGREALELVRAHEGRLSLVLLDLTMPEMSGALTFEALRRIAPELKILLSSGFSQEEQARELLARGANGFIGKPFDLAALSEKVRALL